MGLCKCPKKVVSNLFCFDHRVTVCESCLVLNHRKCVIKSYLQWLKDSDYDSTCSLCGTNLEDDDCIRLICYDLFHKKCLNERQAALPPNTAPSGHSCPSCSAIIFPPQNLVSPVADSLRIWLSQVSWGRNELNLPMFSDEKDFPPKAKVQSQDNLATNSSTAFASSSGNNLHRTSISEKVFRPESPHSILNIESRPLLREGPVGRSSDRDDNKYKRKTPQEIFSRWSRQFYSPAARPPWRRTWFVATFGVVLFVSLIYLMYHFGRATTEDELGVHYDD